MPSRRQVVKKARVQEAYVWVWLPGAVEPVVCGIVADRGNYHDFRYGASYLERANAIALDHLELPLGRTEHRSRHGLHGVVRDAAPDAWGCRVLMHRLDMSFDRGEAELREIDFLINSSAERIGALHVQESATQYVSPPCPEASVEELMEAAALIETDQPLSPELEAALQHGTSIGGARPKALLFQKDGRRLVAKFSSTTDQWPVVRCEFLGMKLAAAAGLNVAGVDLETVDGKDVLLVERFDRIQVDGGVARKHFFSALTALGLSELQARDASYADFADFLAKWSSDPRADCHELYRRMILNMVIGNQDDHARNHAVFWDGSRCRLTPAYDVCVLKRVGETGTLAMLIGANGNYANFENALSVCRRFLLDEDEARRIHDEVCEVVAQHWKEIAHNAGLEKRWIDALEGRAILSPQLTRPLVLDSTRIRTAGTLLSAPGTGGG